MLLAIDVGNTNIVVGVFEGVKLNVSWRLLTLRERTADEVGLMVVGLFGHERLDLKRIDAVVMASVVPPLTPIMRTMVKRYFARDPLVVDPTANAGMPILYDRPAEVGADRIANAIAAMVSTHSVARSVARPSSVSIDVARSAISGGYSIGATLIP